MVQIVLIDLAHIAQVLVAGLGFRVGGVGIEGDVQGEDQDDHGGKGGSGRSPARQTLQQDLARAVDPQGTQEA